MNTIALKIWDWLGSTPVAPPDKKREPKQGYPYRFSFIYAGLLLAGLAALLTALYMMATSPRIETRVKHDAPLTSSSTVADVRGKFSEQPTTAAGAEVAAQVAEGCPKVDIYQQADGAVLVCHA